MAFARDPGTHAYYDARAGEYDEWYAGTGRFADRDRPEWSDEVDRLVALVAALPPARTLDVACGTGFLTRHLQGLAVGLDQSPAMVAVAQERLPGGVALAGDALALPFADGSFDRVLTGHFYGHLVPDEREAFLAEGAPGRPRARRDRHRAPRRRPARALGGARPRRRLAPPHLQALPRRGRARRRAGRRRDPAGRRLVRRRARGVAARRRRGGLGRLARERLPGGLRVPPPRGRGLAGGGGPPPLGERFGVGRPEV